MPIPPDTRAPGDAGHVTDHNQIADELTALVAAGTAETSRAEAAEALLAPLASPALTGSPTAPTQTTGDNTTKIATDAFVTTALTTETSRAEAAEARTPYVINVRLGYSGVGASYSTDDTTPILNAIAAAQAAASITGTMPAVYLPYGEWKITAAVPLPVNIKFTGDGPRNTYLKQYTANTDTVTMLGTSGAQNSLVTIEGMTITGTGSGTGCGINMAWAQNCTLRNVSVTNCGSHGLQTSNCWDLNAYNCLFDNNFGCGISGVTSCNNWSFIGGQISGNALDGMYFNGGVALGFINMDVEANGHNGINFINTYGGLVSSCDFEGNGTAASGTYSQIYAGGNAAYSGPTILANNFSGGAKAAYGVYVASPVNYCTIQGNQFCNDTVADIGIASGATNTVLVANTYKTGSSTSPATVADSGTNTTTLGGPVISMDPVLPADVGYLAWNGDPDLAQVSYTMGTSTPVYTAGKAFRARVNVRTNITVGHIVVGWYNGTGTACANCYLALYNSSGTLLGYSASLAGSANGLLSVALTAASAGSLSLTPGTYQVEIVIGTQSTTNAAGLLFFTNAVGVVSSSFSVMGASTSGIRWTSGATGLSSYEASLSAWTASTVTFWCALAA